MAKKTEPTTDVPAADVSAAPPVSAKRDALEDVIDAIDALERKDQVDVLRAAASFYGLKVPMESA